MKRERRESLMSIMNPSPLPLSPTELGFSVKADILEEVEEDTEDEEVKVSSPGEFERKKSNSPLQQKLIRKIINSSDCFVDPKNVTQNHFMETISASDIATMKKKLFPRCGNPEILKSGGDYYVLTFCVQLIIIVDVLFTYNNIVGSGSDIYSEIFYNNFAGDTVIAIIVCIILIIADRGTLCRYV